MSSKLRVRLRKSPISYTDRTRGTVRALGLHRLHETVEVPDNPATRGMVRAVRFLVDVEYVAPATRAKGASTKHAPLPSDQHEPSEAQGDVAAHETGGGHDA
jgi:large subunit ribosomal protein L30